MELVTGGRTRWFFKHGCDDKTSRLEGGLRLVKIIEVLNFYPYPPVLDQIPRALSRAHPAEDGVCVSPHCLGEETLSGHPNDDVRGPSCEPNASPLHWLEQY